MKTLIIIVIMFTLIFALVACSVNSDSGTSPQSPQASSEPDTPEQDAEQEPDAESELNVESDTESDSDLDLVFELDFTNDPFSRFSVNTPIGGFSLNQYENGGVATIHLFQILSVGPASTDDTKQIEYRIMGNYTDNNILRLDFATYVVDYQNNDWVFNERILTFMEVGYDDTFDITGTVIVHIDINYLDFYWPYGPVTGTSPPR